MKIVVFKKNMNYDHQKPLNTIFDPINLHDPPGEHKKEDLVNNEIKIEIVKNKKCVLL